MASFPFYLDSRCACFWILPRVVFILYMLCICLLWLWCFCVECWMVNALHEDSSCEKNARLLMWCCENCAIAEGCLLEASWPFFAYEKHTWCWGGYFRFTLSKARLFTSAAMQPMLSGVSVRGRIWHAAHALARDKRVLSSLWGKNQVDYYGEPRNFGHLFFSDP